MRIRQHTREAWFERQVAATGGFSWPMGEPPRVDPSRDPQYPYFAGEERRVMQEADALSPQIVAYWAEKRDDFEPRTNARMYVLKGVPEYSGEGAIYTPEYLKRTGA